MAPPSAAEHYLQQPTYDDPPENELHEKSQSEGQEHHDNPPGGFDPTPLPDAPPGYTIKITFHKAINLPVADIQTVSADPYIHATLTADVPKRHPEDPPLTRRTRTIHRSLEPVWEEDWIVANVPSTGFELKCRLYDEDWPDHDDRLGNVTIKVDHLDEEWPGFGLDGKFFEVKKRSGSKRAYFHKGIEALLNGLKWTTPQIHISVNVLGVSDPPHAQMCTLGPTYWVKHFSPMIGRLTGVTAGGHDTSDSDDDSKMPKKYDFQANEIQLAGPVPPKLYHRFVEFRPIIGKMFSQKGFRGHVLNKVLHKQHRRIYNFDSSTETGIFAPCTKEASVQFLRMAHYAEGGRIFTYVLTLDGLLRFTETGKEFGIDLLSKHTMHSDVATYIACSGEFFIRRIAKRHRPHHTHTGSSSHHHYHPESGDGHRNICEHGLDHDTHDHPGTPESSRNPEDYELIIDNDSGTYRPDKCILPDLQAFLQHQFPGLHIRALDCGDEEHQKAKKEQLEIKKKEGPKVRMVLNRSPSSSSFSSDDESRLGDLDALDDDAPRYKSKKERAFDMVEDPSTWRDWVPGMNGGGHGHAGHASGSGHGEGSGHGGVTRTV
ncbi:hypothetical protein B0T20DRAFT_476633 [Sordaria brevicollis]|uniref:C2 domain-containing protein n=1 Tax=Sordaria brevicollis TaxID=83679 RepID=A0AAE0PID1_SORBR|nr:hypothetical protein B0T20DRAFT_476633 [Sordaria brevicollis]